MTAQAADTGLRQRRGGPGSLEARVNDSSNKVSSSSDLSSSRASSERDTDTTDDTQQEQQQQQALRDTAAAAGLGMPARKRNAAPRDARRISRLKSFSDLPEYLRDNEFIVGSYRPTSTVWGSLRTLLDVHNETGNVWTHLLGFLLFLGLACWFATHPPAPLAVTAEHMEHAWAQVQGRFAHLRSSLAADLELVEGAVAGGVAALSGKVHGIGHDLRDGLSHLESSVQEGLHGLQEGLTARAADLAHSAESWQHRVAGGYRGMTTALNEQLQQQLKAANVQWPMPRWPVYVYFVGACACLLTSAVCHLLGCCQRHISQVVWRFDYVGIAVLIVASFYPAVYYAFLCQPFWRTFYLATTTLAGAGVVAVSLPGRFQSVAHRPLRAAVFCALGLWGIVPIAHQTAVFWDVWAVRAALRLDLAMGALYLGGAALYASRVPERWLPGKLDLVGHSHQLWHLTVVAAALVHYRAILVLLQWRDASGGCAARLAAHVPTVLAGVRSGEHGALGIDQVWAALSAQLHEFVGVPLDVAAAAAAAAAPALAL